MSRMSFTRRIFAALCLTAMTMPSLAVAKDDSAAPLPPKEISQEIILSHGLSTFGNLKYPADFPHFDYVNPNAPKGGKLVHVGTTALRTFDSLNPLILKGDAAEGMALLSIDGAFSLVFDTLMVSAGDEPDTSYGLIARQVEYPTDKSWIIFHLREEARFQDGTPLTAKDVKFTLDIIKEKGDPSLAIALHDIKSIEILGTHKIKVSFKKNAPLRDLAQQIGSFPIISKTYYTDHDFTKTSLEQPLGSGPYKVGNLKQGSYIEYLLDPDYWAKDLPVNKGRWNFNTIRYEFYADRSITLQAFKAHQLNLHEEFTSKYWATEYNFPAVQEGRVFKHVLKDSNPSGVQGFYINTRRKKFSDVRVRRALDLAFDFEWSNKNLFFEQYERTDSFFEGSPDLAAEGLPSAAELALLEPFRDTLPPSVFGLPYTSPTSDGSGRIRNRLAQAKDLLKVAGWTVQNDVLTNQDGQAMTIEVLGFSPSFERIINPYARNLELLGISVRMRLVDPAQYERRVKSYDFDMTTVRYSQSNTPGLGLLNNYSSEYADMEGGRNYAGVKDPAVDALVAHIIEANSRKDLTTATRALDRVLRAGHYWVPHWHKGAYNIVLWDEFSWPDTQPEYQRGIVDTWWSKDAETKAGGATAP